MTTASKLIEEVSGDLDDQWAGDEYVRWSRDELLEYANDGQAMIVNFQPTAYTPTLVYQLAAGVRQGLPDGSSAFPKRAEGYNPKVIELIRFTRNMGSTGFLPGAAIVKIDPVIMDETYPMWRSAPPSTVVVHAMFDKNDRTAFDIYPPQPSTGRGWIEVVGSAVPPQIEKLTSAVADPYAVAITLGDQYLAALKTYMLYRAFRKDAKSSQAAYGRAVDTWNLFLTLIGRKDMIEKQLPANDRGPNGNSR